MSESFQRKNCDQWHESRCHVCGQIVCMCHSEFYKKTKKDRIAQVKKACEKFTKEQLIDVVVELRLQLDSRVEDTTKRKDLIKKLLDSFVPLEKRFSPIHKDDKMYCPTCNTELEAGGWEEHFSGAPFRKVGSAGFRYVCPICGFGYYKAFEFRD